MLTKGSIVAKQPERFGIANVRGKPGDDIQRDLVYDQVGGDINDDVTLQRLKEELNDVDFGRPWLGGLDTPHTLFYHDRYGPRVRHEMRESLARDACIVDGWRLNGDMVTLPPGWTLTTDDAGTIVGVGRTDKRDVREIFVRVDGAVFEFTPAVLIILRQIQEERHVVVNGGAPGTNASVEHSIREQLVYHRIITQYGAYAYEGEVGSCLEVSRSNHRVAS